MGKNPCYLCGTPNMVTSQGYIECIGCGRTGVNLVMNHVRRKKARKLVNISFEAATIGYERVSKKLISFGEYLVLLNLDVIAKP